MTSAFSRSSSGESRMVDGAGARTLRDINEECSSSWESGIAVRAGRAFRRSADARAVVALHQGSQGVEKDLRPVERVHVHFSMIIGPLIVGIKNNGGHMAIMSLRADTATIHQGDGVSNHDCTDMAVA